MVAANLLTPGLDSVNPNAIPAGVQAAGYTTGQGIAWAPEGWVLHPNAVRICQDAGATDTTADVLDVESGAATVADVPGWFKLALANYKNGTRPGQRYPCVYASLTNVTPIANQLVAAGLDVAGDAPALWVAHWGLTPQQADADVTDSQPFPIVGYQYANDGATDADVWLTSWLNTVSKAAPHLVSVEAQLVGSYSDGSSKTLGVTSQLTV